jgi:hypothetical protein
MIKTYIPGVRNRCLLILIISISVIVTFSLRIFFRPALSGWDSDRKDCVIVAVTEKRNRAEIEGFAAAWTTKEQVSHLLPIVSTDASI